MGKQNKHALSCRAWRIFYINLFDWFWTICGGQKLLDS